MKEYILPLRDTVIHTGLTVPVYIDNTQSVACVDAAVAGDSRLILAPQHSWSYPTATDDIYNIGTICDIVQVFHMPDGTLHMVVRTTDAVKIHDIEIENGLFRGTPEIIPVADDINTAPVLALRERVAENMQSLIGERKSKVEKLRNIISTYPLPAFIEAIVQMSGLDVDTAVKILSAPSWLDKMTILLEQIGLLMETAKIEESINRRIHQQMESGRKEAILQEKMRAIKREMGEEDDNTDDSESIRQRIASNDLPSEVREKAKSELKRMRSMPPMSTDSGLIKTYLDELLSIPWAKTPSAPIDLKHARTVLDAEHSGMDAVKERILEHIAVMKKTGGNQGSILCFVGAPGVGKTSLGKSIANALGRKYMRISLGGISDEAHFRGHRRTYIGAQMGRVMDALKRCKENNPVIVLDEIDKMGRDWRGDPEAALLEILDPEQNKAFRDHYLEVDFDLSSVLFIATANSLNLSNALKDRMEIIEIPGYSVDEKVTIAREHLIKRAARDTGWDVNNIIISDDTIRHIISKYTSEQGVRELQRELTAILRRSLLENDGEDVKTEFTSELVDNLLRLRKSAGFSKRIGFGAHV